LWPETGPVVFDRPLGAEYVKGKSTLYLSVSSCSVAFLVLASTRPIAECACDRRTSTSAATDRVQSGPTGGRQLADSKSCANIRIFNFDRPRPNRRTRQPRSGSGVVCN